MSETQVQPDQAMAQLQAKIARLQKIFGFISGGQLLVGLLLLAMPLLMPFMGMSNASATEPFAYQGLGVFFIALAYAASVNKKDLAYTKITLATTAIGQLGFALIGFVFMTIYSFPSLMYVLPALSLLFGGLPALALQQFIKATRPQS